MNSGTVKKCSTGWRRLITQPYFRHFLDFVLSIRSTKKKKNHLDLPFHERTSPFKLIFPMSGVVRNCGEAFICEVKICRNFTSPNRATHNALFLIINMKCCYLLKAQVLLDASAVFVMCLMCWYKCWLCNNVCGFIEHKIRPWETESPVFWEWSVAYVGQTRNVHKIVSGKCETRWNTCRKPK